MQNKQLRKNDKEPQFDEHINESSYLRMRIYLRFWNATKHQTFITYNNVDGDGIDHIDDSNAHELMDIIA